MSSRLPSISEPFQVVTSLRFHLSLVKVLEVPSIILHHKRTDTFPATNSCSLFNIYHVSLLRGRVSETQLIDHSRVVHYKSYFAYCYHVYQHKLQV